MLFETVNTIDILLLLLIYILKTIYIDYIPTEVITN